jgi:hypothetical protein
MTRELNPDERRTLNHLLCADNAHITVLRGQLEEARVIGHWVEGLPSVDLEIADAAPRALIPDGPLDPPGVVVNDQGEFIGHLMVWIKDGALSALELAWIGSAPPQLPPDDHVILGVDAKYRGDPPI